MSKVAKRAFRVSVTAWKECIVHAENEEEALKIAADECTSMAWEIDDLNVKREMDSAEVERARRHGVRNVEDWDG